MPRLIFKAHSDDMSPSQRCGADWDLPNRVRGGLGIQHVGRMLGESRRQEGRFQSALGDYLDIPQAHNVLPGRLSRTDAWPGHNIAQPSDHIKHTTAVHDNSRI
jgi:hypothetical protein